MGEHDDEFYNNTHNEEYEEIYFDPVKKVKNKICLLNYKILRPQIDLKTITKKREIYE
jgi:hypothetical protein